MKKIAFKIRRRIIVTFLFCVLSVVVFAVFSFQSYREIGHRLRLLELANDLYQEVLEIRRFEKNFFLYRQPASLVEATAYFNRVESIFRDLAPDIIFLKKSPTEQQFLQTFAQYQEKMKQIQEYVQQSGTPSPPMSASWEEALRNLGQRLVELTGSWAKEERLRIDQLFQKAMYLFLMSIVVFCLLGIALAFYIARLFVQPLLQMQQAMDKIALGDFTLLPETGSRAEEFNSLYKAFNRMIHELEAHQEQLVQSRKIAAIGTLTAGIAHELNNPINNIAISAEALEEDFSSLSQEEALAIIHDIQHQSERASEIVKDLLDFARAEQPEVELLGMAELLQTSIKLVRNQLSIAGIQEESELPRDLPPVRGDRKSLQQVFLNLFINAIQAMSEGGVLKVKLSLLEQPPWQVPPSDETSRWIKVEVSDTGEGIDPQHLPRIFDPFFTTKSVGKGTGLGLSVTYGIIKKHNGYIEVQSRKGQGTTFTVLLPVAGEADLQEVSGT